MNSLKTSDSDDRVIVYIDSELEELIPQYLTNRQRDIELIRDALLKGDFVRIQQVGHGMKGSGGGYGFGQITLLGTAFEQAALDRDDLTVNAKLMELDDYLMRLQVVYR